MTELPGFDAMATAGADVWQLRVDLAAALRAAAMYGLHEGVCNHFSVMLPGRRDRFLINPKGLHWAQMRASDLLLIDDTGAVIEGNGLPARAAFTIHVGTHLHHPDAPAVLHAHMPYATALTSVEDGRLEMIHQNSLRFLNDCAYDDDYGGVALELDEGIRMARLMQGRRVLFLRHHGQIVVGQSVAEAFDALYYLERAAQVQVLAMSTGRKLLLIPDPIAQETARAFPHQALGERHLTGIKRLLDEREPEYAS
jgi:ribulose-5-phosphate 4-epimerase/fuculose-1-phosphate aldolase